MTSKRDILLNQAADLRRSELHTPERCDGESFAAYKLRRKASAEAARNLQVPAPTFTFQQRTSVARKLKNAKKAEEARLRAGPAPKFPKLRRHKRADPIKPTWPNSDDQRAQSRPLLYLSPLAELRSRLTIGRDDKGFPIMHKDWPALQRAAKQGRGEILRAYLQR